MHVPALPVDAAADAVYENALAARDAAGREREQVQALAYGVQALELGAERPDVGVDAELHALRRVRDDEERLWLESGHLALPSAVAPATLRRSCCGCQLRHLWLLFEQRFRPAGSRAAIAQKRR